MISNLSAPQPLTSEHICHHFSCGEASLNKWLMKRAMNNHMRGAGRTFVVVDKEKYVQGYYTLSAGALGHTYATGKVRRNMPDPIPVVLLGRLAVDTRYQRQKLGGLLLRDAELRVLKVAQHTAVRALIVHALHEHAKAFYLHYGFEESPYDEMLLMLRLPPC